MLKDVEPKPDFSKQEHKTLKFWDKSKAFNKLQAKNKGKKTWSFVDGPITANNPMGVHHAWGRTLKDLFQRYKAMRGFDELFQPIFDCQGLWVEVEVEKDLGFNSKKEIEEYGLDKFSKACRERVDKYSGVQIEQSKRLGMWMDWEKPYFTMSDNNIIHIWHFLKKCNEKGWLVKGFSSMPWCARCGTSLSQHELADTYEEVEHESVFLKFPLQNKKGEYLVVWTTTPWTLMANVAASVHPDLIYAKVKKGNEIYYLAKETIENCLGEAEILEEMTGKDMVGWLYDGPFDELPLQNGVEHKIIPWKEVGDDEGSGIVHIAPGGGAEDFELGKEHNLSVLVPIDENGIFINDTGEFAGKHAQKEFKDIFASLEKKGLLLKTEKYKHRYPHCWRCKEQLVFRAVDEWFIKSDEIRKSMKEEAAKVRWMPESIGKRMQDWLNNMGDWVISRKRYWGLPLPIYPCKCGEITIVGSKDELRDLAADPKKVDALPELHRPWIDEVKIKCPKCGKEVGRIKDVGDCWLDAGILSFAPTNYLTDKKEWAKWFPADFIVEMREQVRLWYYSMLFLSVTLEGKTPYKEVLSYEKVYDELGKPMHKSTGNAIWFDDAAEKMGVDVIRYMYVAQNPSFNLLFGYKEAEKMRRKLIQFWNVYSFFVTYAKIDKWSPGNSKQGTVNRKNLLDKWIISRLEKLNKDMTESMDKYDSRHALLAAEAFLDDLSNWYVRRSRRRFWKSENDDDKAEAYQTLYDVITRYIILLAPILPFITEEIYQNLVVEGSDKSELSVHLEDWPKADAKLIDEKLNNEMESAREIVALGLAARAKAGIKVRQPLAELLIQKVKIRKELVEIVKEEMNVKDVKVVSKIDFDTEEKKDKLIYKSKDKDYSVEGDKDLVVAVKTVLTPALEQEGMAREIIRNIQGLRKEADYQVDDRIKTYYQILEDEGDKLKKAFDNNMGYILKETLTSELEETKDETDAKKEVKIGKGRVWLGVKK